MAGSSSDLHSVRQIWLTASQIIYLNIPGIPKSSRGVHKYLKRQLLCTPDAVRRKRGVQGNRIEYRGDLLPIHAQKALLTMQPYDQVGLHPLYILSQLYIHSGERLFSCPAEMVDEGLNLLSVLNRVIASNGDFVRDDLRRALDFAEGLIRAGNSLSKTEGGAA